MTIVSRWLVMPIATGVGPAASIASRAAPTHALEDLYRIVLDPARLRKILRNLTISAPGDATVLADHEAGHARGSFVDRQDVFHVARYE